MTFSREASQDKIIYEILQELQLENTSQLILTFRILLEMLYLEDK